MEYSFLGVRSRSLSFELLNYVLRLEATEIFFRRCVFGEVSVPGGLTVSFRIPMHGRSLGVEATILVIGKAASLAAVRDT